MATYSQILSLRNGSAFRDRVEMAVVFFARYILNEAPTTPQHNIRYNWARNAYQNPSGVASGILNAVALDGNIVAALDASADPTDAQIQSATESAINQVLNF